MARHVRKGYSPLVNLSLPLDIRDNHLICTNRSGSDRADRKLILFTRKNSMSSDRTKRNSARNKNSEIPSSHLVSRSPLGASELRPVLTDHVQQLARTSNSPNTPLTGTNSRNSALTHLSPLHEEATDDIETFPRAQVQRNPTAASHALSPNPFEAFRRPYLAPHVAIASPAQMPIQNGPPVKAVISTPSDVPPASHEEPNLQEQLARLTKEIARVRQKMAPQLTARDTELLLAQHAGRKERRSIVHSRAIASQDSVRSTDGPLVPFLQKSTDGYLLSSFVVPDSRPGSQFLSQSNASSQSPSGGSASESSFVPTQTSDQHNIPDSTRQYNFRHQGTIDLRGEFIRKNMKDRCQRCGTAHEYIDELCTHSRNTMNDQLRPLSTEQCAHRIRSKRLMGFPDEPTQFDDDEHNAWLLWKEHRNALHAKAVAEHAHLLQRPSDDHTLQSADEDSLSRSSAHSSRKSQSSLASKQHSTSTPGPSAIDIAVAVATAVGNSQQKVNNLVTNDPPIISNVEDSNYLMDTIWPAYQKYVHIAGDGPHRSLWDLYSPDQKQTMIDNFSDPITTQINPTTIEILHRNREWFDSLSNEQFLEEMCKELGFQDVMATEIALKAIKFKGTVNQKKNWVNFKAAWTLAVKQMSTRSQLSDKSMSTIFKNSIPDQYWRTNYEQQNHKTWPQGYAWCISKLLDTPFQNGFSRHTESLIKTAETKHHAEIDALKRKVAELESSSTHKSTDKQRPDKAKATPIIDTPGTSVPEKAAWDTQKNVNPLWDPANQRDDNKDKKQCSICSGIHKYKDELCTASKIKGTNTDTPRLSPAELQKRKWARQQLGFYCSTLTNPPTEDASAPSSIESHHKKAAAVAKAVEAKPKK